MESVFWISITVILILIFVLLVLVLIIYQLLKRLHEKRLISNPLLESTAINYIKPARRNRETDVLSKSYSSGVTENLLEDFVVIKSCNQPEFNRHSLSSSSRPINEDDNCLKKESNCEKISRNSIVVTVSKLQINLFGSTVADVGMACDNDSAKLSHPVLTSSGFEAQKDNRDKSFRDYASSPDLTKNYSVLNLSARGSTIDVSNVTVSMPKIAQQKYPKPPLKLHEHKPEKIAPIKENKTENKAAQNEESKTEKVARVKENIPEKVAPITEIKSEKANTLVTLNEAVTNDKTGQNNDSANFSSSSSLWISKQYKECC